MKAYHVTPTAHLRAIQAHGLRARVGPRARLAGEPAPAVYLFPDSDTLMAALGTWLLECFDESTELTLLGVVIDAIPPPRAFSVGYELCVPTIIPASRVWALHTHIADLTPRQLSILCQRWQPPIA